jgi:Gtr1/RagA G protein conserved region
VEFRGFFNFKIYDFPGFYEANDLKEYEKDYLRDCGAIIYVVDYKAENLQEAANHFKDFYKML